MPDEGLRNGSGETILCLADADFLSSSLAQQLAHSFTLTQPPPALVGQADDAQARALFAQWGEGNARVRICATSAQAGVALRLASLLGERAHCLVLISPELLGEDGQSRDVFLAPHLANVVCPVLAVFGHRDPVASPATAGRYKRAFAICHLMFVYDAADLLTERSEAVAEAIGDFCSRGEGFLVNALDGRLFP